jgi:hypothetical protein
MTILQLLSLWLLPAFSFGAGPAPDSSSFVRFHLEWKQEGLSLRPRVFVAPVGTARKSGTTQVIDSLESFGKLKELKDGLLPLAPGDSSTIYLVLENRGKETASFSVAPHETIPAASALGFHFQCLCNGTLYKVPPGKLWVRALSLRVNREATPQDVTLRHVIFRR